MRKRWRLEVAEWNEEVHRGLVVGQHVLEPEEADVAAEVVEESEEGMYQR